ncbi:helix-turn-helix domain-containing protein [Streptomyces sp. NPDC088254]|uniref:helix-turn-helix domain-containing protein n=1 Tax=Streptomyces sp. NPDC088254 TaxID=3365847 RepID=UPI0037FC75E2
MRLLMYDRALLHTAARMRGIDTPSALAREAGLSVPTAWRIWNGVGAPRGDHADRVADIVGISASTLYTRSAEAAA